MAGGADAGLDVRGPGPGRGLVGDGADLEVVDDQQVEVGQAGAGQGRDAGGSTLASSRLVSRPAALACRSTVTQPLASSPQGASMRRCTPGQAQMEDAARGAGEVEMLRGQEGCRALVVDVGAPPGPARDIGVGVLGRRPPP